MCIENIIMHKYALLSYLMHFLILVLLLILGIEIVIFALIDDIISFNMIGACDIMIHAIKDISIDTNIA